MTEPRDPGRLLYPFLYDQSDPATSVPASVKEAVRRSILSKSEDVVRLRRRLIDEYEQQLAQTAREMARAFGAGARLIAFGNGGSATDAQDAAIDCMMPPFSSWRRLPALSLVADPGILTAVANDVGFDNVFVRQLIALGKARDIALGFSTSGNSANVLLALEHAKRMGMMTIAMAGDTGGMMDRAQYIDRVFVARIDHIPRIQEGHATIWHTLLELTQMALATGHGSVSE